MKRKNRVRRSFKKFLYQIRETYPEVIDPESLIRSGQVLVDGRIVTNPASLVRLGASIVVVTPRVLRGEVKLQAALDTFQVSVTGRVALDVGASTGGFTRVLLTAGATRCYAVDVGHGQLLGSLRCDSRVVNLESTNLGDLNRRLVPEVIDLITMDLSYLSLASAVPQLDRIAIADDADLVVLVKPMFELRVASVTKGRCPAQQSGSASDPGDRVGSLEGSCSDGIAGARCWRGDRILPSCQTG